MKGRNMEVKLQRCCDKQTFGKMKNNYIRSGLYLMCVLVLFIKGCNGFFIRHSASGLCLKTDDVPFAGTLAQAWGYNYYVTFYNACSHSHAQFRYVDKKFVHNIEKIGTFLGREGKYSERFIVYSNKCSTASFVRGDEFALKPESGFLKIYNGTYCATPDRSTKPFNGSYPVRTTTCDQELQKFTFGSVTNKDSTMTDVNCASTQKIEVVKAGFGESTDGKSFVYDNDAKCSSFALCFLKAHCDGKNPCNMAADYNLFKVNQCPKTSSQLYMEYNCVDTPGTVITTGKLYTVSKIRLSQVPYRGSIEVFDGTTWINANDNTWSKEKEVALCHHLGFIYTKSGSGAIQETVLAGQKVASGNLYCYGTQPTRTSCCAQFSPSTLTQNSKISYIECLICNEPLLQNSAIFPNSIFSASDANGYKARLYANGWCPTNSGSKYLQIDLQTEYYITHIVTLGDKAQTKWLESYSLQYSSTLDGLGSSIIRTITANHDAYRASIIRLDIVHARYLKITPKQGKDFCLRVELCGHVMLPDQVQNVILHITARSARVSWSLPQNERQSNVTYFLISLNGIGQKHNISRLGDSSQYTFNDLKRYNSYNVTIIAGSAYGVGKSVSAPFTVDAAATMSEWSDEGSSKTVFYIAISILLIVITVLVVVVIYLCLHRPRIHPPASVNNQTFSNHIYDEIRNLSSSNPNP